VVNAHLVGGETGQRSRRIDRAPSQSASVSPFLPDWVNPDRLATVGTHQGGGQ